MFDEIRHYSLPPISAGQRAAHRAAHTFVWPNGKNLSVGETRGSVKEQVEVVNRASCRASSLAATRQETQYACGHHLAHSLPGVSVVLTVYGAYPGLPE